MFDTALIVATIAGGVALVSTGVNVANARAIERIKADNEDAKVAAQDRKQVAFYSEPMARAAFDLQSRLYNIMRQDFLGVYLERGSEREQQYAIENTTFLVAQFLCWVKLARREVNFIHLDDERTTKALLRKQDEIYACWGTDRWPSIFRIFAGEQRALGEALIVGTTERPACMGYGQFLAAFPRQTNFFVDRTRDEVKTLPSAMANARCRLATLQHLLIDILDLIDPDALRFPRARRSKA